MTRLILCVLLLLSSVNAVLAESLYQITLLRAATGSMPALMDLAKGEREQLKGNLVIMRHSQGDHWDLMLMKAAGKGMPSEFDYGTLASFQHDFIASSDLTWPQFLAKAQQAGMYHIEMFNAAADQHDALMEQRIMENNYLEMTQRKANTIFVTRFGSDVDSFTVGFYKDFSEFAAEPDLPAEVFEKAAKKAGFAARNDIGFHLRRTLVMHQDTFATKVE